MLYNYFADLILVLHLLFILFVLLGGLLAFWKTGFVWCHIPAVLWAACLEFFGWICPLTPLENLLRQKAGTSVYSTGFVEHYVLPVLYPAHLTRKMQVGLGITVLCINMFVYLGIWLKLNKKAADNSLI